MLDWFHIRRRIDKIARQLFYLPYRAHFGRFLSRHSRNLDRVKYVLWNQGIEMADWAMKIFRCGLVEGAWDYPEMGIKRFRRLRPSLTSFAHTSTQTQKRYRATRVLSAAVNESERIASRHSQAPGIFGIFRFAARFGVTTPA
jgi:hypothetical protein